MNFKYELEEQKYDDEVYFIFNGVVAVCSDGTIIGKNLKKSNGKPCINHKKKMYYVGKLVLMLFGDKDIVKDFSYLDGNKDNNHIDNLKWGSPHANIEFPDHLIMEQMYYIHVPSWEGIYVSAVGRVYSMRYKGKFLKPRVLEGIPCVSYGVSKGTHTSGATMYIHLLVLEAWKEKEYGSVKCIWKDGDRLNYDVDNLQVATYGDVISNHFVEGRRDPNMIRDILDAKYGKGNRPWSKLKRDETH